MRHTPIILTAAALIALAGCQTKDETVAGYADATETYLLESIDGVPFDGRATLTFPEEGKIAGQAPCNSYRADLKAPYPWFETSAIAMTRKACIDMNAEAAFTEALNAMTQSEISGPVVILTNEEGRKMVFRANS
ncbi:META domain-containing protein [Palleronia caenipelagi]|uniref:META domain-containing protein n=1 Tax=Palleronia caenipelagi TaxID=2489174 RepID=A0A547QAN3_9RHOB|nr:META domain-containing protein [Palleronia caenipelagi]TRD23455.1 META domain-containing protein [Palleronia caenipelagi]